MKELDTSSWFGYLCVALGSFLLCDSLTWYHPNLIFSGRPAPQKELTNEFNVLEAGLWNSISLNKGISDLPIKYLNIFFYISGSIPSLILYITGCYKGQETISRLITYDGVKQRLWGVSLSSAAEPGSPIVVDGKKVSNCFVVNIFEYCTWSVIKGIETVVYSFAPSYLF